MDRRNPGGWLGLAGVLAALAAIPFVWAALFEDAPFSLTVVGLVLAGLAVLALLVWLVLFLSRPRIRYQLVIRDPGPADPPTTTMFLACRDGYETEQARCVIRKTGPPLRESDPVKLAVRAQFTYPQDFERSLAGSLGPDDYQLEFQVRRVDSVTGEVRWVRVKRRWWRITKALHAEAERLFRVGTYVASHEMQPDGNVRLVLRRFEAPIGSAQCTVWQRFKHGALDDGYVGFIAPPEKPRGEVHLVFPDDFRREAGQTHKLTQGGFTEIESEYSYPTGEPGDYELVWKEVWYATSGTFAPDHEITADDFRRERKIAQDRFSLLEPNADPAARASPWL